MNAEHDAAARQLIESTITRLVTHGWCQRVGQNAAGAHCVLNALGASLNVLPLFEDDGRVHAWARARQLIGEAIRRRGGHVGITDPITQRYDIAAWNDAPERTLVEVLEVLHDAALPVIDVQGLARAQV